MPRIDPLQLLKCLSVLLTPEGGILSKDEVSRLVNLMTKFSKKLVSKCIYVLILKSSKNELLDMFMAEGGWALIQSWLQDAVQSGNWYLVKEILELLLITPVDVERLKLNILPKLIKSLSRRDDLEGVAELSTQLVKQWLVIVKGSSGLAQAQINEKTETVKPSEEISEKKLEEKPVETITAESISKNETTAVTEDKTDVDKLKQKDDKNKSTPRSSKSGSDKDRSKDKERERRDKHSSSSRNSSSKSKTRSSSSSSSSSRSKDKKDRDKERDRERSRSKSRSSSTSSREKERDKSRHNGSLKSSSSSSHDRRESSDKKESSSKKESSDIKDKSAKDKDTLEIVKPPSIDKLGRIPKKSHVAEQKDSQEVKKKAFSVGIRKDKENDERPKTVKVFNSKMRSTGLEEEVKPAPSRPIKKPTTPVGALPLPVLKRPSPPRDIREPGVPVEKRIRLDKIDIPERPGSIKLIAPPKNKPMLQESDLFNDALTAATSKKEPKKKKRRASVSKEPSSSPSTSPSHDQQQSISTTSTSTNSTASESVESTATVTAPSLSSPLGLKNIAPINFYQDTLREDVENEENKENDNEVDLNESGVTETKMDVDEPIRSPRAVTPTEDDPEEIKKMNIDSNIKGVLLYTRKKGPKKSITWKSDVDLVEVRYFELDETERVNVTKAFNDMAKMDISNEREALQLSRKLGGEDLMEIQTVWRIPFEIDMVDPLNIVPGHRSLEKDIQFAREKNVLQAIYFDKRKIPDSPAEPIPEIHQMSDPVIIALEDPEGQEIDLRNTPWPEPKGNAPLPEPQIPIGGMFTNMQGPFMPQFNNMPPQFQNVPPRFPVPNAPMGPGPGPRPVLPNNFHPANVMPNGNMMVGPNQGDMMMPPINPNIFPGGPPIAEGYRPEPDFEIYNNANVPSNLNMYPPNFNNHRNNERRGGFRRGRGGNHDGGNWMRMNEPGRGNWRRGGGGNRGNRMCKNIANYGFCRSGDNCPFLHP